MFLYMDLYILFTRSGEWTSSGCSGILMVQTLTLCLVPPHLWFLCYPLLSSLQSITHTLPDPNCFKASLRKLVDSYPVDKILKFRSTVMTFPEMLYGYVLKEFLLDDEQKKYSITRKSSSSTGNGNSSQRWGQLQKSPYISWCWSTSPPSNWLRSQSSPPCVASMEEVKTTVCQMGPLKALGPDGFNGLFYHQSFQRLSSLNMVPLSKDAKSRIISSLFRKFYITRERTHCGCVVEYQEVP